MIKLNNKKIEKYVYVLGIIDFITPTNSTNGVNSYYNIQGLSGPQLCFEGRILDKKVQRDFLIQ